MPIATSLAPVLHFSCSRKDRPTEKEPTMSQAKISPAARQALNTVAAGDVTYYHKAQRMTGRYASASQPKETKVMHGITVAMFNKLEAAALVRTVYPRGGSSIYGVALTEAGKAALNA